MNEIGLLGVIYLLGLGIICYILKDYQNNKKLWKYSECKNCYILYPHLSVPEICVCGNDMKNNYNNKSLKIIEFANGGKDERYR